MKDVTISISKILSKLESNGFTTQVSQHKMSEFKSLVEGLDSFVFTGLVSERTFNKYHNMLMDLNYKVQTVYYSNPKFDDAIDFRTSYQLIK